MDSEKEIIQIIVNSGQAKSLAMESIYASKEGDFVKAFEKLEEYKKFIKEAHSNHFYLLQSASSENFNVTMLLTHAQDHLMNAIFAGEMAEEIKDLYQRISKLEENKA